MSKPNALSVFCGSKHGKDPAFREAAESLGRMMAERGIRLVYGGGGVGLMGVLADVVLSNGGAVTGVIPQFLFELEAGHGGVSELVVVESMHERQNRMADMADGFVVLPGGLGTVAEAIEMMSWKKLRLHEKPVVLVSVGGYWDDLSGLIDGFVSAGFAHPDSSRLFTVVDSVEDALNGLEAAIPPGIDAAADGS